MRIANNVPALLTHINLRRNDRLMSQHMNRLSTGLRINTAREDAAGMAIANKLSFQLVGLERASDNSQHGISVIQTAEGALNEVHAMLQRIRELSVQAANDTNVEQDRMAMQREINNLIDEITAISGRSEFNTIKLLNGEAARVANSWAQDFQLPDGTNLGAVLTRTLVTPLFISQGTPAGHLQYTILSPAQPARIVGDAIIGGNWNVPVNTLITGSYPPFNGGTMRINGIDINVSPNNTMTEIWQMLVNASEYTGVIPSRNVGDPNAPVTMTSARNGAHERVELSGNAHLWQLFGMYMPAESYAISGGGVGSIPLGQPPTGRIRNPDFDNNQAPGPGNEPFLIPGTPPTPSFEAAWDTPLNYSGLITIRSDNVGPENGWPITISEGMTRLDIFNAIVDAGNVNRAINRDTGVSAWEVVQDDATGEWRIESFPDPAVPIWVTGDSVSHTVSGQPAGNIWETEFAVGNMVLGNEENRDLPAPSASRLPVHTVNGVVPAGTDVQVRVDGLFVDGNPDLPVSDFNNSMAVTTSGNRIIVTSAQGHRIELNTHIPTTYRGQVFGQVLGTTLGGNIPSAANAFPVEFPAGSVITVNGVDIPVPPGPHASAAALIGIISPAINAVADVEFEFTSPTWTLTNQNTDDPQVPLILGGTAAVWEAIGTPIAALIPIVNQNLDMELRIEEFGGLRIQIGPNYNMNMDIQIPRINAETLGLAEFRAGRLVNLMSVTTTETASRAIDQSDTAIRQISQIRSRLGAYQNRLEHTIKNLDNAALNTAAARSRVQDADMAREMTLLSKRNVMYQAGLAILGQANQRPQMILQLLQ